MKRTLTTAILSLILLTGYALWSRTRCGWYEGRVLPCPRARIAQDRFCVKHDKDQRARIEKLLQELKSR
jgi:hypothetical protein